MEFYRYICNTDEYHSLQLPQSVPTSWINQWDGRPFSTSWSPIKPDVYPRRLIGNFPGLAGNLPVFDETAWSNLKSLIGDHVEALPLESPDHDWPPVYMINVTTILDCLDFNQAIVERFEEGMILSIQHFVFKPETVRQIPIFRIKDCELYTVIVSQEFREVVESLSLKGLLWKTLP